MTKTDTLQAIRAAAILTAWFWAANQFLTAYLNLVFGSA